MKNVPLTFFFQPTKAMASVDCKEKSVLVTNVSPKVTPEMLKKLFMNCGTVLSLTMGKDLAVGLRTAWIEYETAEQANLATMFSNTDMANEKIDVIVISKLENPNDPRLPVRQVISKSKGPSCLASVSGITPNVKANEIQSHFAPCGQILFIELNRNAGTALIEFRFQQSQQRAMEMAHPEWVVNDTTQTISKPPDGLAMANSNTVLISQTIENAIEMLDEMCVMRSKNDVDRTMEKVRKVKYAIQDRIDMGKRPRHR